MAIRSEALDGGAVHEVVIDRPERRGALDVEACEALADAVHAAAGAGARVIVLRGTGGHFCAGADLKAVEDERFAGHLRRALQALTTVPVPVIAAVEGAALGAGTQLAVACDLRVATADARFGIPAAKLGLMVDQWTCRRLAALAGHGPARLMLLAAEELSGEDAHRLGLVQKIGSADDARAWAAKLATLAPLTIAGHKLSLERLAAEVEPDADVRAAFEAAWRSEDLAEGKAAFHERRAPVFQGR